MGTHVTASAPATPQVTRRRMFLGIGLLASAWELAPLAACQAAPPATNSTAPPGAMTAVPPAKPPAKSTATVPSTVRLAKPTSAPPLPVVARRPMYQQDRQHTGRSPHAGPRRVRLLRSFHTDDPRNRRPDPYINLPDYSLPVPRPGIWTAPTNRPDASLVVTNRAGRVMLFGAA